MKAFKAHSGQISAAVLSHDQNRLATTCAQDGVMKIFDVANFDLIEIVRFTANFEPGLSLAYITKKSAFSYLVAVGSKKSN